LSYMWFVNTLYLSNDDTKINLKAMILYIYIYRKNILENELLGLFVYIFM